MTGELALNQMVQETCKALTVNITSLRHRCTPTCTLSRCQTSAIRLSTMPPRLAAPEGLHSQHSGFAGVEVARDAKEFRATGPRGGRVARVHVGREGRREEVGKASGTLSGYAASAGSCRSRDSCFNATKRRCDFEGRTVSCVLLGGGVGITVAGGSPSGERGAPSIPQNRRAD